MHMMTMTKASTSSAGFRWLQSSHSTNLATQSPEPFTSGFIRHSVASRASTFQWREVTTVPSSVSGTRKTNKISLKKSKKRLRRRKLSSTTINRLKTSAPQSLPLETTVFASASSYQLSFLQALSGKARRGNMLRSRSSTTWRRHSTAWTRSMTWSTSRC